MQISILLDAMSEVSQLISPIKETLKCQPLLLLLAEFTMMKLIF